ncbi:MAG TPA: hypothetical protein VFX16_24295 [Pseudonocardiaceae bacterium]|nr:hypothetical protein [Pseudonocardiaceae bacterium]
MDTSTPITFPQTDQFVHGLRLLRLVRLLRELRSLWRLAILALPIWFGLIVWLQASTPDDSAAWNWADTWVGPGFLVIGILFVVGILGMVAVRFATGMPGRVAAAFVPMASRGTEPTVVNDADAMRGLLPRLRPKPLVSMVLMLLFLVLTAVGVIAGINLVPVYRANQGHGGTTVTIGVNATITGYRDTFTGGRQPTRHRDYFLDTPEGTTIAEDRVPANGQRWEVLPNRSGNAQAYLIGGHDYLLMGGLLLLAAVADVLIVLGMSVSYRRERRLRTAGGHVPLAYSVRRLAEGARPVVRFDPVRSITLGLPPLREDSDAGAVALLRRRRLHVGISVVVVAGLVTGVVLAIGRTTTAPPPPSTRDITLSYLVGTSWSTDTEAFYEDADTLISVTKDMLREGGAPDTTKPGPAWSVVISSQASGDTTDANVDVVGIGAVAPDDATAGGIALRKEVAEDGAPAPVAITGLPTGWTGILTNGKPGGTKRTADVFGSAAGSLVDISVEGTDDTTLAHRSSEIATAIARRGIAGFVTDTAR